MLVPSRKRGCSPVAPCLVGRAGCPPLGADQASPWCSRVRGCSRCLLPFTPGGLCQGGARRGAGCTSLPNRPCIAPWCAPLPRGPRVQTPPYMSLRPWGAPMVLPERLGAPPCRQIRETPPVPAGAPVCLAQPEAPAGDHRDSHGATMHMGVPAHPLLSPLLPHPARRGGMGLGYPGPTPPQGWGTQPVTQTRWPRTALTCALRAPAAPGPSWILPSCLRVGAWGSGGSRAPRRERGAPGQPRTGGQEGGALLPAP